MNLIGVDPLVRMRLRGAKPGSHALLFVDDGDAQRFGARHWPECAPDCPELIVPPSADVSRVDFRPLVGLRTVVSAAEWSERLGEVIDALRPLVPWLAVVTDEGCIIAEPCHG